MHTRTTSIRTNQQYIAGRWCPGAGEQHVQKDLFLGTAFSATHLSTPKDVDLALSAAAEAASVMASVPSHTRAAWLRQAADRLEGQRREIAGMLVAECGKPLSIALSETDRSVETLRFSAEEALRLAGEMVPMDASPRGEGHMGFYLRVPVGVVAAITPFNAPLNLLCHKLGPALAAGNAIVVKPDLRAASCAATVFSIFHSLDLPPGSIGLVHGGREVGEQLIVDERVNLVSFTGGEMAARSILRQAGLKRVSLELGGNAGNLVLEDADLDMAAEHLAVNAFTHAGQSCIGVQRIYVHDKVYDTFMGKFLNRVAGVATGDPYDEKTMVGPMIDSAAVDRLMSWIRDAVERGARVLHGGTHDGLILAPTVLTDVNRHMRVVCEEVFGPIVTVTRISGVQEGIDAVNDSRYGLQAGVFTASLNAALACVRKLRVGGVVVNGTSNYRVDHQPYGGVKCSGIGREGPRYAIEEMTERRMVVLW
ncbi:aldehyde dehydrogenase family protein [Verticiella sediminum]|uniref:Aldehyde dehydrogenase family protein n=1 Tax=Verticiella sediminum TaxID=1247510 RepID=A0A556ARG3_9BURK|nr:aldehyde dehydrogenase family protein [Verticiella sediminum]TSH94985.1 aldehyde dehydrogenase family protein [Verticiella sediminum]